MSALTTLGSVIALGIAGFDPFTALLLIPAIAAGAQRRAVVGFAVGAAAATIVAGLLVGESVRTIARVVEDLVLKIPAPARCGLEVVIAVGLGIWAFYRWKTRSVTKPERKHSHLVGTWSMTVWGALWGLSILSDPAFYGITAFISTRHNVLESTASLALWFVASQWPLCLIVVIIVAGNKAGLLEQATALFMRFSVWTGYAMTALIGAGAVFLVINAGSYLVTRQFWPF